MTDRQRQTLLWILALTWLAIALCICAVGCVSADDFEPMISAQQEAIDRVTAIAEAEQAVRADAIEEIVTVMGRINSVAVQLEAELEDTPAGAGKAIELRACVSRLNGVVQELKTRNEISDREVEATYDAFDAVISMMQRLQTQAGSSDQFLNIASALLGGQQQPTMAGGFGSTGALPATQTDSGSGVPWYVPTGLTALGLGAAGWYVKRKATNAAFSLASKAAEKTAGSAAAMKDFGIEALSTLKGFVNKTYDDQPATRGQVATMTQKINALAAQADSIKSAGQPAQT